MPGKLPSGADDLSTAPATPLAVDPDPEAPPQAPDLSHIEPALRPFAVPIDSISADPANVNTHPEAELAELVGSMRRFGQRTPILADAAGATIAGAARLEAARRLLAAGDARWAMIAVVKSTLAGQERTAYAIADNRIAHKAAFDDRALAAQLQELSKAGIDLSDLGWEPTEFKGLLDDIAPPEPPGAFPIVDENIEVEHVCPRCAYRWSGGEHEEQVTPAAG